ncbi:purple acid phosphatase 3-like isoform X2 [Apium graveolens]|uniref:purple acid phosphatase 3-like isoform X2 n=1 Tax=Apium graveolens TaxID=4045 RepID=UPI003D79049A
MHKFLTNHIHFTINYRTMSLLLWICCCLLVSLHSATSELQTLHHQLSSESLSLLVVGDWGRRGAYNQSQIAHQMGIIAGKLDIDFIISTGDNFYDDGLTDENDPAFEESFSNIYTAPSLQKQWYTVLGNHDYRGDALAQLSPTLTIKDSRWFCLKSYILKAEFFFIDTTPFQDKYFSDPEDHVYDWRGVLPRDKYISTLLKDLDVALRESTARWKIVVGHHTIKSAGHHGNTQELVSQLLPLLQANNVDFYVNGHDHCLEHISSSDSSLQYLTSGGGSKAWKGDISRWDPVENKLYYDGQGFMSMQISSSEVDVVFYDVYANVLHKWCTSDWLYNVM